MGSWLILGSPIRNKKTNILVRGNLLKIIINILIEIIEILWQHENNLNIINHIYNIVYYNFIIIFICF